MSTKAAVAPSEVPAVHVPDSPLSDWTPAEIRAVYPKKPDKPIKHYTIEELVALKNFGPSTIGGELYLAAQATALSNPDGRYGPAILSKGSEPVPFVSEQ